MAKVQQTKSDTANDEVADGIAELYKVVAELRIDMERLNANLERDIRSRGSWKIALRNGVIGAVGGLIASSLLIAILLRFAVPLKQMWELKPTLDRLAQQQSDQGR